MGRSGAAKVSFLLALAGLVAGALPPQAKGQDKGPAYTVRFAVFTMEPLVEVTEGPGELPPLLQATQEGCALTLGANAEEFLQTLAQIDPRYRYRLRAAGATTEPPGPGARVECASSPDDPMAIELSIEATVKPTGDTVTVYGSGALYFSLPGTTGRHGMGWGHGAREHVVPGRTYSKGLLIFPSGVCLVPVFCVVPADK
ncbi:MAG: hypothetical protein GX774_12500 [Armatimonadetes bacterium]|nr:hypothetical protein [Armatimonadota bacterium]